MKTPTVMTVVASISAGPRRSQRGQRPCSARLSTLIGPPLLRPHWPTRPLRCPQRGRNSHLGAALRRSFAQRPERDPAQQMLAQQDRKHKDRQEEQRRPRCNRGPVLPTLADDDGGERRRR